MLVSRPSEALYSLFLYISVYVYLHVCGYVCMCACVCVYIIRQIFTSLPPSGESCHIAGMLPPSFISFLPSSHPPIHPSIFPKSVFRYNSRRIAQPPCDRPLDRATHLSSVRRDLFVKSIHHNRPRATAIDRRVSDRSLDDWDLIVFVYWWYLLIRRFYLFVVFVYLLYLLFRKTVNFLRC